MTALWIGLVVVALLAIVYWQVIVAEGAYLGSGMVAWTYDVVARHYDGIKQFVARDESNYIAYPILQSLRDVDEPVVLDVATGTGRLPLALLRDRFEGQVVGLDLSRGMLRQARAKLRLYDDQVLWLWHDASQLPFDDGTFDAVVCLESLEFMPQPLGVLYEMVRVLIPGGVLFITNRVGKEARFLPGKAIPRDDLGDVLAGFSLCDVQQYRWQVQYDLVMARKEGRLGGAARKEHAPVDLLCCPRCQSPLVRKGSMICTQCAQVYPIRDGIVHLHV